MGGGPCKPVCAEGLPSNKIEMKWMAKENKADKVEHGNKWGGGGRQQKEKY